MCAKDAGAPSVAAVNGDLQPDRRRRDHLVRFHERHSRKSRGNSRRIPAVVRGRYESLAAAYSPRDPHHRRGISHARETSRLFGSLERPLESHLLRSIAGLAKPAAVYLRKSFVELATCARRIAIRRCWVVSAHVCANRHTLARGLATSEDLFAEKESGRNARRRGTVGSVVQARTAGIGREESEGRVTERKQIAQLIQNTEPCWRFYFTTATGTDSGCCW